MSFKSWREQRQSLFYFHRLEVCRRLIMLQSCILKSQSCQFLNSCQSARTDAKQRKLSRRQSAAMATGPTTFEFKYGREDIRCFFFFFFNSLPQPATWCCSSCRFYAQNCLFIFGSFCPKFSLISLQNLPSSVINVCVFCLPECPPRGQKMFPTAAV